MENSQQQLMTQIAQALQQGADPKMVMQELVKMGIPQEQAVTVIQQVAQQLQQQQPAMKKGGTTFSGNLWYGDGGISPYIYNDPYTTMMAMGGLLPKALEGVEQDDCPPGWIKDANGKCVQDPEARKALAEKAVKIAWDHINKNEYYPVPKELEETESGQEEGAYGCIGGACSIYTDAGIMSKPNWSNTDFALHAKDYGFPNQGYGLDQLRYLEPGDLLQRYKTGHKNRKKAYPHHSQIYLGRADNGDYLFFDNYAGLDDASFKNQAGLRSYTQEDMDILFDPKNKGLEGEDYGRIYKVNPYITPPVTINPEAVEALKRKQKLVEDAESGKNSSTWSLRKDSPYYKYTPKVINQFIEWANNQKNIVDLVKKLGVDESVVQDELLNTFGELGVENNWSDKGKGLWSSAENVAEKGLTALGWANKFSVGPGQIKMQTLNDEEKSAKKVGQKSLKEQFNIKSAKDLYDVEKVIPLMTAMNIRNRQWMERKGDKLAFYLTGQTGTEAEQLMDDVNTKRGIGRWSPYMYRGSLKNPYDIVKDNAFKAYQDYVGQTAANNRGMMTSSSVVPWETYWNDYVNSEAYKEDLRHSSKLFEHGSYADKVFHAIDENIDRTYNNPEQVTGPKEMEPVEVIGKRKKKKIGGLIRAAEGLPVGEPKNEDYPSWELYKQAYDEWMRSQDASIPSLPATYPDEITPAIQKMIEAKKKFKLNDYKGPSIWDFLSAQSKAGDFTSRKQLAKTLGIANYRGTAGQNSQMMSMIIENPDVLENFANSGPIIPTKSLTTSTPAVVSKTTPKASSTPKSLPAKNITPEDQQALTQFMQEENDRNRISNPYVQLGTNRQYIYDNMREAGLNASHPGYIPYGSGSAFERLYVNQKNPWTDIKPNYVGIKPEDKAVYDRAWKSFKNQLQAGEKIPVIPRSISDYYDDSVWKQALKDFKNQAGFMAGGSIPNYMKDPNPLYNFGGYFPQGPRFDDGGQFIPYPSLENFVPSITEMKQGGIYIKPSKRGTFTAAAKKHGKSVQGFASQVLANKENYSSAMVKKANFARNAASWKHEEGGIVEGQIMDVTPDMLEKLKAGGYTFELVND